MARLHQILFVLSALSVAGSCVAAYYQTSEQDRRSLAAEPQVAVTETKECPEGYVLAGKNCEKFVISPASLVCPAGTVSTDGQCLTFAPPSTVCPPRTRQNGDICTSTHISPVSYQCQVGNFEESSKQCKTVTEVPPVCPAGFDSSPSGDCYRASPSALVCPPEYTLQNKGVCTRSVSTPASVVCNEGLVLEGAKTCSKLVPVASSCPAGHEMHGDECIQFHSLVPGPCPPNFESRGSQCARTLEFPPSLVCLAGSTLAGNMCVQEIPVPPTCPFGTQRSPNGSCLKPTSRVPVCPAGFEMIESAVRGDKTPSCKQTLQSDANVHCNAGFSLMHGKCKRAVVHPLYLRCPQGELQGDRCIVQSNKMPVYQCPAGFQISKGPKCVQKTALDCSYSIKTQQCDFPAFVSELAAIAQNSQQSKHMAAGGPRRKLKEASVPQGKGPACRVVSRVVPRMCPKEEVAPVRLICPDGSEPVGKMCPSVSTFEPEAYCIGGMLDQSTGRCVEMQAQQVHRTCPADTQLEGRVCIQHHIRPASLVCPENAEMNGDGRCAFRVSEVHIPNKMVKRPAKMVCEQGQLAQNRCLVSEAIPKDLICPQGTQNVGGGKCVTGSPVITPAPLKVTEPARHVCPDGSPVTNKSCLSTTSTPADRVCPEGGELQGENCLHFAQKIVSAPIVSQVPAVPVCPGGHSLQGEDCVMTISKQATVVCPPGHDMQKSEQGVKCTVSHPLSEVCPPGTQREKEGCLSKSVAAPIVTVTKQCPEGEKGC